MTCLRRLSGLATMIAPVIVTVPPTGTSPVHTAPVAPIDSVPELARLVPPSLICVGRVGGGVGATLIPIVRGLPGVGDRRRSSPPSPPGVTVPALDVESIVSCDTVTVAAHCGSVLPAGQLLPADGELIVLARIRSRCRGCSP